MHALVFWLVYYLLLVNVRDLVKAQDSRLWDNFKVQNSKNYNSEEEQQKMETFQENIIKINEHNEKFKKGEVPFEMGMNNFGDMTAKEFEQIYLSKLNHETSLPQTTAGQNEDPIIITSLPPHSCPVPDTKNWVCEGAATKVKNQYRCGCCWAFAIAGVIELHHLIKTKTLVDLSAQNLLDCVGSQYEGIPHTCKGGSMIFPLQYVVDNKGIDTEKSYPYTAVQGKCAYKAENIGATIKSYKRPEPLNEELFKGIVGLIGPITCSFAVEAEFIQFYKSGIYSSEMCKNTTMEHLNHAVVIVGYGTENNKDYWLIKNSWGEKWGDNGYFKVGRGGNECGVAFENYYPII